MQIDQYYRIVDQEVDNNYINYIDGWVICWVYLVNDSCDGYQCYKENVGCFMVVMEDFI